MAVCYPLKKFYTEKVRKQCNWSKAVVKAVVSRQSGKAVVGDKKAGIYGIHCRVILIKEYK